MLNGPIIENIASTSGMKAMKRGGATSSTRSPALMWLSDHPASERSTSGHRCIRGSWVGSAYAAGHPSSAASGRSSKCQGSLP